MIKKLALSALLLSFLGVVVAGSNAVFTSVASNDSNTFSTGTVVISTSPSTAFITFGSMLPKVIS